MILKAKRLSYNNFIKYTIGLPILVVATAVMLIVGISMISLNCWDENMSWGFGDMWSPICREDNGND